MGWTLVIFFLLFFFSLRWTRMEHHTISASERSGEPTGVHTQCLTCRYQSPVTAAVQSPHPRAPARAGRLTSLNIVGWICIAGVKVFQICCKISVKILFESRKKQNKTSTYIHAACQHAFQLLLRFRGYLFHEIFKSVNEFYCLQRQRVLKTDPRSIRNESYAGNTWWVRTNPPGLTVTVFSGFISCYFFFFFFLLSSELCGLNSDATFLFIFFPPTRGRFHFGAKGKVLGHFLLALPVVLSGSFSAS